MDRLDREARNAMAVLEQGHTKSDVARQLGVIARTVLYFAITADGCGSERLTVARHCRERPSRHLKVCGFQLSLPTLAVLQESEQ